MSGGLFLFSFLLFSSSFYFAILVRLLPLIRVAPSYRFPTSVLPIVLRPTRINTSPPIGHDGIFLVPHLAPSDRLVGPLPAPPLWVPVGNRFRCRLSTGDAGWLVARTRCSAILPLAPKLIDYAARLCKSRQILALPNVSNGHYYSTLALDSLDILSLSRFSFGRLTTASRDEPAKDKGTIAFHFRLDYLAIVLLAAARCLVPVATLVAIGPPLVLCSSLGPD